MTDVTPYPKKKLLSFKFSETLENPVYFWTISYFTPQQIACTTFQYSPEQLWKLVQKRL